VARTWEADQLTQAYRRDTAAITAALVRDVLRVWPLLDLRNINSSWPALLVVLKAIITSRREASTVVAENYLRRFRQAEGVTGSLPIVRAPDADDTAMDVSLRATGPASMLRSLSKGVPVETASDRALTTVSGAATRIALDGGRQTVVLSVQQDQRALGWMRVIRPGACAFCAMLASRGPVYKTSETAGDDTNRFHDHCGCVIEPVYSRDTTWPESSRAAERLWMSSTSGKSGREAINAFRVAYEATL
jgi:hypothetical protein